jgi:hypothetical protein
MKETIAVWEGEGGSLGETSEKPLTGTVNQIELGKPNSDTGYAEFDRVNNGALHPRLQSRRPESNGYSGRHCNR